MKQPEVLYIQTLLQPDTQKKLEDFGSEYTSFPIDLIKSTSKYFLLGHMGAAEFEDGSVVRSIYRMAKESYQKVLFTNISLLTTGKCSSVYYICPRSIENYVINFLNVLQFERSESGINQTPPPMKREISFEDSLTTVMENKTPSIGGWLDINNDFMFFVDKGMYVNVRELLGLF